MRKRALVVAATITVVSSFAGCRDLSFQEPGDDNTPPQVAFVSPRAGDTLPLWWHVALSAEDADGLGAATLSCNGAALFQWVHAPYEAELDLSRCLPPNATAVTDVTLDAVVADGLGVVSAPVSVTVRVDPSLPKIVAQVPARVAPGAAVSFPLAAESPLGTVPAVTVDGVPATVAGDTALQSFTVSFTAPLEDPPTGTGVEALYVTDHHASVEIVAAAPNGNEVRLTRPLIVSRVIWERPVPGHLRDSTSSILDANNFPRSDTGGLWIALAPETTTSETWTPGFFRAADGTFVTPTLPPGVVPRGFSHDGRVLVDDLNGTQTLAVSPEGVSEGSTRLPDGPFFRFADKTCAMQWTFPGMCLPGTTGKFVCIPASATAPPQATFATTVGGIPGRVVRGGDAFLAFGFVDNQGFCGPDDNSVMTVDDTAAQVGQWGVVGPSGALVTRAIPLGDSGAFFAQEEMTGVRVEDGAPGAMYPTLGKKAPGEIVAGRDNGDVLVISAGGGQTTFSIANPAGENIVRQMPGIFPLAPSPLGWTVPANVVALADGGFVYLAHPNAFGRAVVVLNADLTMRWIYPYPRATSEAVLVGDAPDGLLYLVDLENDEVVALARP